MAERRQGSRSPRSNRPSRPSAESLFMSCCGKAISLLPLQEGQTALSGPQQWIVQLCTKSRNIWQDEGNQIMYHPSLQMRCFRLRSDMIDRRSRADTMGTVHDICSYAPGDIVHRASFAGSFLGSMFTRSKDEV